MIETETLYPHAINRGKAMNKRFLALIVCALLLVPAVASADNDARDYIAAPPGTILSMLYYFHVTADSLNADGDKIADVDFTQNLGLWREVYYFQAGPLLIAPQLIVPFGNASLDIPALNSNASSSGIGDIILLGTVFLVNKPSQKMYLGFTPYFFFPTGAYNDEQTVNLGSNRFTFREELNFTKGWNLFTDHNLYAEVTLGGDFYTTNTDYLDGHHLTTAPLFNLEGHLSYDLTANWWISADFYGHWGGGQSIDGASVDDSTVNSQTIGGTLAYNLTPGWQVLFQYKGDVGNQNSLPTQAFQVRLLYATDFGKFIK